MTTADEGTRGTLTLGSELAIRDGTAAMQQGRLLGKATGGVCEDRAK